MIFATVRKDSFDLEPTNDHSRCSVTSVAAHTLYEKTRPDLLPGPGGELNLQHSTYEQLTPTVVRVRGAVFEPRKYQVKLEGAKVTGFRSIYIGGIREPGLIAQIDVSAASRLRLADVFPFVFDFADSARARGAVRAEYEPDVRGRELPHRVPYIRQERGAPLWLYGILNRNADHTAQVMGPLEPVTVPAHELCIVGEVLAPTQELAHSVCNTLRVATLHCPYPYQARVPPLISYLLLC